MTTPHSIEGIVGRFAQHTNAFRNDGYALFFSQMDDWLRTTLTTYGQSRYEEGVKVERAKIDKEWVSLNLRNDNEENWSKELASFGVFMQNLTTPREDNK